MEVSFLRCKKMMGTEFVLVVRYCVVWNACTKFLDGQLTGDMAGMHVVMATMFVLRMNT